jgi:hypothetical protein
MDFSRHLFFTAAILFFTIGSPVYSQEKEPLQKQPPPKYRMELVYIFEHNLTEFIFVIGNTGFKSVDSLKEFVGNMPPDAVLEWAPGCTRFGKEPLLSSEKELEDFKVFCAKSGVKFILIPAG